MKQLLAKLVALMTNLQRPNDDEIVVERVTSLQNALRPGESILWKGAPAPRYAWNDHDQLEPAGATGMQPSTLLGRKIQLVLALLFILFMAILGAGALWSATDEIAHAENFKSYLPAIFLVLLGLTLLSGLSNLLRPFANRWRARRLEYIITSQRAIIMRHGHPWSEIWVKSPIIFTLCLLLLYGVAMFSLFFLQAGYHDLQTGAGFSAWAARVFIVITFAPLAFILSILGCIGLRFQTQIIYEAITDGSARFIRSFEFGQINYQDFPIVVRKRQDGSGDVLLDVDAHYVNDIDFPEPWFLKTNSVGFLSVPDAQKVAKVLLSAIKKDKGS